MMFWIKVKTAGASLAVLLIVSMLTAFAVKAAAGDAAPATAAAAPQAAGEHNFTANGVTVPEVISQIHNAPEWQGGAAYKPGDRVVNLKEMPAGAYECVTGGTSGASAPTGSGSAITDGAVTWKYLSEVDYTSITGWLNDAPRWKKGATYTYHDYVAFGDPLCAYRCGLVGPGASTDDPTQCNHNFREAWGLQPRDVKPPADGYLWQKMATIGYSSDKSYIPMEKFPSGWDPRKMHGTDISVEMKHDYTGEIWNDRVYVLGENGEDSELIVQDHKNCHGGDSYSAWPKGTQDPRNSVTITAAPGESFIDHADRPLRYDQADGVAICLKEKTPFTNWDQDYQLFPHTAVVLGDMFVKLDRLQIKSVAGPAVYGWNYHAISNCLMESDATGKDQQTVWLDCNCQLVNCAIIGAGQFGIGLKYETRLVNCTIVSTGATPDGVGMMEWNNWPGRGIWHGASIIKNCAFFGWAHPILKGNLKPAKEWWNAECADNATDAPGEEDSNTVTLGQGRNAHTFYIDPLPGAGTRYKVPYDNKTFFDPANDWRLTPGSPLKDVGIQLGHSVKVELIKFCG